MITPQEIQEVQFSRTMRGYDEGQVDRFLDQCHDTIVELQKKAKRPAPGPIQEPLTQPVTIAPPPAERASRVLQLATETADRHIAEAKAQADQIIAAAQAEADRLAVTSKAEVHDLVTQKAHLEREIEVARDRRIRELQAELKKLSPES